MKKLLLRSAFLFLIFNSSFLTADAQYVQSGSKLVGTGGNGGARQGWAVALSADSSTFVQGAPHAKVSKVSGAAWIFTRNGNNWSQQAMLIASGDIGYANVGYSVAISEDGNTVLLGGCTDNDSMGAVWVFVRNGTVWSQQAKLVSSNSSTDAMQGYNVSISYDGNTALVGAPQDNDSLGASFVFVRNGTTWSEQAKLVGTGGSLKMNQGASVTLSANGNTAAILGEGQWNTDTGAVWTFDRIGTIWTQNGTKLVPPAYETAYRSVALSGDGLWLAMGDPYTGNVGGISIFNKQGGNWVYDQAISSANYYWGGSHRGPESIAFSYDGKTLVYADQLDPYYSGQSNGRIHIFQKSGSNWFEVFHTYQPVDYVNGGRERSISVNASGNMVLFGGWNDRQTNGACWVYQLSGGQWNNVGGKLVGTGDIGYPQQGFSLAISADGKRIISGGANDNGGSGAFWTFNKNGNSWVQSGGKTTGTPDHPRNHFAQSLGLSADGSTIASIGYIGWSWYSTTVGLWVFSDSSNSWRQDQILKKDSGYYIGWGGGGTAISDDGNTIIFGNTESYSDTGYCWVFVRNGNNWVQQGNKIVATSARGQGQSLALSANGDVAAMATKLDSAVFILRRTGGVWQEEKRIITKTNSYDYGTVTAISDDGNTVAFGVPSDSTGYGAVQIYTYDGNDWNLQAKIRGTGAAANPWFGNAVSISADGNTLVCGGPNDGAVPWTSENGSGAFWVFKRNGNNWIQYGNKLIPNDTVYTPGLYDGGSLVGSAVAISSDGYTIAVGGKGDGYGDGATWVYEFTGMRVITDSVVHSICGNSADGTITVHGSDGLAPYTYRWSNGASGSGTIDSLAPGWYYLTVTDAAGDSSTQIFRINASGNSVQQITADFKAQCGSLHTGEVTLHVTNGVPPYQYNWSTSVLDTDSVINNLEAGAYFYTVTDATGCALAGSSTIPYHTFWTSAYAGEANCGNTGSAIVNAYQGIAPYSYLWNTTPPQTSAYATALAPGNHSFTVTDTYGCKSYGKVRVDSICKNIIEGYVFNDLNGNCVLDSNEVGLSGWNVTARASQDFGYGTSSNSGYYNIEVDSPGTYSISSNILYGTCYDFNICDSTHEVTFSGLGDTAHYDMGFAWFPGYDLYVGLTGGGTARPGGNVTYSVNFGNLSINPLTSDATITFVYDPLMNFITSSLVANHNSATRTLTWTVPAAIVNASGRISVEFGVSTIAALGDILDCQVSITPDTNDCRIVNNSVFLPVIIRNSYDPNIKECYPDSVIETADTVLTYTIHFQNTGNDTAHFIVVKDTLSPYVDPVSVRTIATSIYPFRMDILEHGILTWIFDPAFLPDSAADPVGSNGFITYTVEVNKNLPVGTVVTNRASIYFDYNEAVHTNTAMNTVTLISSVAGFGDERSEIRIYPNPATNSVTISIDERLLGSNAIITDCIGRKVGEVQLETRNTKLETGNFAKGIYLVSIRNETGNEAVRKLVIE